jgi:enamine deaminase RidA (YjgF/YER057c/UK114 family)
MSARQPTWQLDKLLHRERCYNPVTTGSMRGSFTFLLALLLPIYAAGQEPKQPRVVKKKNQEKEPVNQTLPLLKDPPAAISAETSRLVFHVSPLSDKGLLSQQIRDALKAMMQTNHGATIVKLRAFVAGTGDMRRVQSIVSEVFTDKRLPLPALSIIQVGALDLEGAQVVIESASTQEKGEKRAANPNGLAFFSGQSAEDGPKAVGRLEAEGKTARVAPEDMLRVTCFLSSIDEAKATRAAMSRAFPSAVTNFVQALRLSTDRTAVCEAVGRRSQPGGAVEFSATSVLVNTPKLVLSGIQMAFLDQDADLRLAFERLQKAIEPLGAGYKDVIYLNVYPLTRAVEQKIQALQSQFIPPEIHPAGTALLFEGLPSLDATVAVEVIAAVRN